jgi:hypothetical protein
VEAPHSGDLIVELQEDDVPDGEVARNGCEQLLFSYKPFLFLKGLAFSSIPQNHHVF